MHKIDKFIADIRQAKEADTKAFMGIHLRIMEILGWRTIPNDFIEYPLRSFRLKKWATDNTLRIAPRDNNNWGEVTTKEYAWWSLGQVPTPDVQDAFFRELQNEIKDDQI